MRPYLLRAAAGGCIAALVGALGWLLLSVPWAWAIWLIAFCGFGLGWVCRGNKVRGRAARQIKWWQGYADELEDHWERAEAERAKDALVMAELHSSISKAYDAGIFAGQTIQRDREDNGLL